MTKCTCGHPFEEHAGDHNHTETLPCWHAASTGEGCTAVYDDRCKNYTALMLPE